MTEQVLSFNYNNLPAPLDGYHFRIPREEDIFRPKENSLPLIMRGDRRIQMTHDIYLIIHDLPIPALLAKAWEEAQAAGLDAIPLDCVAFANLVLAAQGSNIDGNIDTQNFAYCTFVGEHPDIAYVQPKKVEPGRLYARNKGQCLVRMDSLPDLCPKDKESGQKSSSQWVGLTDDGIMCSPLVDAWRRNSAAELCREMLPYDDRSLLSKQTDLSTANIVTRILITKSLIELHELDKPESWEFISQHIFQQRTEEFHLQPRTEEFHFQPRTEEFHLQPKDNADTEQDRFRANVLASLKESPPSPPAAKERPIRKPNSRAGTQQKINQPREHSQNH